MSALESIQEEITDILQRIEAGEKEILECREHVRDMAVKNQPTYDLLVRLGQMERLQEVRRTMLTALERHRDLLLGGS